MKNSKMKKSYTAEKMQKSTSSFKNVQSKCEQVSGTKKVAPEAYSGSYQNICQHCFGKVAYF